MIHLQTRTWTASHFPLGPGISFSVRCRPITPSIPGVTLKAPYPAGQRIRNASFWLTALVLSRWEITDVCQRSWATAKSWHSTNYSWRAGRRADYRARWSGFVWWPLWLRVCLVSPDSSERLKTLIRNCHFQVQWQLLMNFKSLSFLLYIHN